MDKRNFLEGGRYDTCTFYFFLVFWDTLMYTVWHCRSGDGEDSDW